jgi:hypothetical protein
MSERREFEIEFIEDEAISVTHESGVPDGIYQTVELKPGEIIIDRTQFRHAFGAAFCTTENASKEMDAVLGLAIERRIFGEGE